jgi:hypothetical protein
MIDICETRMIIATRVLTLRRKSGDIKVPVRIYAPQRDRDLAPWKCRYSIKWPKRTRKMEAYGEDALRRWCTRSK